MMPSDLQEVTTAQTHPGTGSRGGGAGVKRAKRKSTITREEEKEEREGKGWERCERFRRLKERQTQEGGWEAGEYKHQSGPHVKENKTRNRRE